MIVEVPELGLAIRPYRGETCWQLYEWAEARIDRNGNAVEARWEPVEWYPSSLEHGLLSMQERAVRRSRVRGDLTACINEVRRIGDAIERAARAAMSDV